MYCRHGHEDTDNAGLGKDTKCLMSEEEQSDAKDGNSVAQMSAQMIGKGESTCVY